MAAKGGERPVFSVEEEEKGFPLGSSERGGCLRGGATYSKQTIRRTGQFFLTKEGGELSKEMFLVVDEGRCRFLKREAVAENTTCTGKVGD